MEFKKINVVIRGRSPLLMNNIAGAQLSKKSKKVFIDYKPEEEVKKSLYVANNGEKHELYVPSYAIYAMMLRSASSFKIGKKGATSTLAGTMKIEPEKIFLGTDKYEIDVRSVVIQKARVLKARAKIPDWVLKFQIIYSPEYCDADLIRKVLEDGGIKVGLLDYRPATKGWFGTFEIESFDVEE